MLGPLMCASPLPVTESTTDVLQLPRSITRLIVTLDAHIRKERGTENRSLTRDIDKCHLYAIYAFAARWLPVSDHGSEALFQTRQQHMALRSCLWDLARQHILVAISHPTYRSAHALHLFATSGAATHSHFDTLVDGCHDISLQHHERLRLQALEFCASDFSFFSRHASTKPGSDIDYSHVRDILYWTGILTDVWRTTFCCRPAIVLPGRIGEARVWSHVREHLAAFDRAFAQVRESGDFISDPLATIILQHASACKSMFWYSVSKVQDSLINHIVDDPLDVTFATAMREKDLWERVFGSLVGSVERDYVMLDAQNQIGYCKQNLPFLADNSSVSLLTILVLLVLHVNTGILILLDLLEQSQSHPSGYTAADLLQLRLSPTRAIVNAIGITLRSNGYRQRNQPQNIMLLDPHPDTASDCILRCGQSLLKLHVRGVITPSACQTMLAVVFEAFDVLMAVPGKTAANKTSLERLCADRAVDGFGHISPWTSLGADAPGPGELEAAKAVVGQLTDEISGEADLFRMLLGISA
ncbi:uncharacterized protein HMPREF1541_02895 [Cyphellophora europaea CBS 101466]|uniref:Transcription factor domain-containing protein n=1 Tax=Cyphellophora europaea (strain CBS 101466) TaxID=1220924 RepID=W2S4W6_CYPE1|nr:uncharacterized protein HMPREF1541_02895 [Cyphellophora europaea CBS 101466]ETN43736.1 hypothetical protein HMPREF1541_02895 [Cyphellophora europaea CBS 101466]